MKYIINFSYDGTNYIGWQIQKELNNSVQFVLQEKMKILFKQNIKLQIAGRTDKGVHAVEQVADFDFHDKFDFEIIKIKLNALLKNSTICVNYFKNIDENFSARYSCKNKEYRYYFSLKRDLFFVNYWKVHRFDINYANECAKIFTGTHDFSSFRDSDCQAKSPLKTIDSFVFYQENNFIIAKICAKSFLHHQIRIMVGTIYQMFVQKKSPCEILNILSKKNRASAGMTAPAKGLFLYAINY